MGVYKEKNMVYDPKNIEKKWQDFWYGQNIFKTGTDYSKPKFYALDMFPYPSAAGLHVGHPLGYTATDIVSRFYRMKGYNVLHPMGWDAFGLPAEQHAIETGEHPAKVTHQCIENFKRQLKALGFSYDWSHEITACDPSYYKWTQYIFTLLQKKGLAYQAEVAVNWCPVLKTVLANEEIVDGFSERGGHPVYRVPMKQWMLKITAYAEKLLNALDELDWPESTKEIQRHWIGRSEGALVRFKTEIDASEEIEVYTTRHDTLFGVTFLVLAPEHPLVSKLTTLKQKSFVEEYLVKTQKKSDMDRSELNKVKTGVFTGSYAINPLSGEKIPVWIADYVLLSYGTGAVMGVPGHDERDKEFVKVYDLPSRQVIDLETNKIINSAEFSDLSPQEARERIVLALEKKGVGKKAVTYRLRDWVFSRQRYWGEPIPIMKDKEGKIVRALSFDELPLSLPEVVSYEPTGEGKSPLASCVSWVQKTLPNGETVYLETDTMPGSAASSWYFIRFIDPTNTQMMADPEKLKYWMPVDLYVGGQEHAVGHLLYSRFWTQFLYEEGICPVKEPFQKLVHQGMIYRDGGKMSKSKGNGVSPDEIVAKYGADSLRVYEMFMGPLTQSKEWDENNLAGIYRFLGRFERLFIDEKNEPYSFDENATAEDIKLLHKTIKKVTLDIETLSFNTAIAQMMIFSNHIQEKKCRDRKLLEIFVKLMSPFAPHLSEEIWSVCFNKAKDYQSVSLLSWPVFDPALALDDTIKMGVQVNGKHRGEIEVPLNAEEQEAMTRAKENQNINVHIQDKNIKKVIFVKNKILNILF